MWKDIGGLIGFLMFLAYFVIIGVLADKPQAPAGGAWLVLAFVLALVGMVFIKDSGHLVPVN